jgi:hypothetical protein
VHINAHLQSGTSNLILKCESNKLSLAVTEGLCEPSGPLGADGSATMFDIAEVGTGNAEALSEDGETLGISFTNGGKGTAQSEGATHDSLQEGLSVVADALFSSSHAYSPLQRRRSRRGMDGAMLTK